MWRSTHRRLLQRLGRRTSGGISRCRSILPRETPLWPSLLIRVTGRYPLAALAYTACGCVGSPKASQGSVAVFTTSSGMLWMRNGPGPGAGETAGAAWHIGRPNLQRKVKKRAQSADVNSLSLSACYCLGRAAVDQNLDLHTRHTRHTGHTQTSLALSGSVLLAPRGPGRPKQGSLLAREATSLHDL